MLQDFIATGKIGQIAIDDQWATISAAMAPLCMNSRGERNWVLAGRSALVACSKTAPETLSTTRTQIEPPVGGAPLQRVSTPPVAMATDAPLFASVAAPAGPTC